MNNKPLTLAVDMYGCPNRCLHCWLSHMPNRTMEPDADRWIVDQFRPYFDQIEFFSWLREPDFCPDYRDRWERDKVLSVNAAPERFELASFWRLSRDPEYVGFLKEVGVGCVQLTFFGMEETTDRYIGRKGAFQELLKATEILINAEISPRWQTFINEENKDELPELLHLSKELNLPGRCEVFGREFRFFVHPGSCEGENRKLYPVRIFKEHIPRELIPYFLNYDALLPEKEWYEKWREDPSHVVPHNTDDIVLYVANNYDLFFNFTHMRPEWRIGNLKTDPIEKLVRRVIEEDIPALNAARNITLAELVSRYADPLSEKAFEKEDYQMYLLNTHMEMNTIDHTLQYYEMNAEAFTASTLGADMEAVRRRFLAHLPADARILEPAAGVTEAADPCQPAVARIPASSPPSMEMTPSQPAVARIPASATGVTEAADPCQPAGAGILASAAGVTEVADICLHAGARILEPAAGVTEAADPCQPAVARILDFGCGSGRDSRAFLDLGYKVSALDGSAQLCRIAGELTGLHVRCLDFRDYVPAADERYEGIWACASLLHLRKAELLPVLRELTRALVPGGILYVSFKYGDFEGERNGRYFTDLTLEGLRTLLASLPELKVAETWVTGDVRPGRSDERWLNALLEKNP